MPKAIDQWGIAGQMDNVRRIYDKYGAMLLGYLAQTLDDRRLAEECLTIIFTELAIGPAEYQNYTWLQLHRFTKAKLADLGLGRTTGKTSLLIPDAQGIWSGMTDEQRCVFYNAYHCGRPIATIAQQLGKPEGDVKKVLATAFATIRKS